MTHKPISITDLIIEITRRCNMNCAHCLRGEKQNLDMHPEIIDKILTDILSIDTLIFTGGEPTLNVPLTSSKRIKKQIFPMKPLS